MIGDRTLFNVQRVVWTNSIEISIGVRAENGRMAIADPLTFRATDAGQIARPALTLRPQEAQTLIDELWNAGLRPSEGAGSAGAMAAVQAHLQDMRRLVFKDVT